MMKTKKLIFINIYFFIVMIASILLIQSGSYNALALSSNEFSKSAVMEDLRADSSFVEADYNFDKSKYIELISVMEYCYSSTSSSQGNYGLYFYIYNPKATNIASTSKLNKVQLAVSWVNGKASDYEKYALKFCNKSNEATNKNMFYKYQLVDHKSSDGKTFLQKLNKDARSYDISGIELLTFGANSATEYNVSSSYVYTGYAAGYGGVNSTLTCNRSSLETITLNVNPINYRTGISAEGAGHQNDVNSVYFGVGNEYFDSYGGLQKIKAEWWEYKTSPIFVTTNSNLHTSLMPYMGENVPLYNSSIGWQVYDNPTYGPAATGFPIASSLNYNGKNGSTFGDRINKLSYIFKVDNFASPGKVDVSSSMLKNYIYSYNKGIMLPIKDGNISSDLFLDAVDSGRTKGYNCLDINADDTFDLLSYDSTDPSLWQKFRDFGLSFGKNVITGEDYFDLSPIYIVSDSDLVGTDESISSNLLISLSEVADFKSYYNSQKANDSKVVLFRFANTDYYSKPLTAVDVSKVLGVEVGNPKDNILYMAQESVFFDFDVIQLTFNANGSYTVIPAVSSPTDVINSITSPLDIIKNKDWSWLLGLILIIIFLLLMLPFLPGIIRFIVKVIAFPFKTMGKAVKGIKRSGGNKSNN